MFADEIYLTAAEICAEESELLRLLCQAAETELRGRLREDADLQEIKPIFVTAAALYACGFYYGSTGESVKSWKAGQVSVTGDTSWQDMHRLSEMLLSSYVDVSSGFDFRGVTA